MAENWGQFWHTFPSRRKGPSKWTSRLFLPVMSFLSLEAKIELCLCLKSSFHYFKYTVIPGVRKCAISEIWRKFRQLVEAWIRAHLIDFLMGHLESASILPPFEAYGPNFRFYSEFFVSKFKNLQNNVP